jgi:hypothetical protein
MMDTELRDIDELEAAGFNALERELGPVNALRFLRLFIRNDRDYTESRHEQVDSMTPEDVRRAVEELRVAGKLTRQRLDEGPASGRSHPGTVDL